MGKIYVVGFGPGSMEDMTFRVRQTLESCKIIAGNQEFIDLLRPYLVNKEYINTDFYSETQACDEVIKIAYGQNEQLCVLSVGDSGIYGIAGILIEKAAKYPQLEIEVVPGITTVIAAAAIVGAPIMSDFAVISLDEGLASWRIIEKRLECASMGDFVICLYNVEASSLMLIRTLEVIMKYRGYTTSVAVVRKVGLKDQSVTVCMLTELKSQDIDNQSVIIIGNSKTYIINKKMVTPKGYNI